VSEGWWRGVPDACVERLVRVVRVRLLGPVEVGVGDRMVDVGAARQRCVLAVLLLAANRGVSVDQLVERVWAGRRLPERPRKAAQVYVSLLRSALATLDGVAIVRRPDGYLIEVDELCVDVFEFRQLVDQTRACPDDDRAAALFQRVLGMWRGEAFGELDTPWLADVRENLNQQRWTTERDLTDLQLWRGTTRDDPGPVVPLGAGTSAGRAADRPVVGCATVTRKPVRRT
jgi:DNA-binding SARP family transcriptional activator